MIETVAIRKKIALIKKKLLKMLKLPEKWESVYLYASVIVHPNKLETGEMFFYYFPKGIVKKNPVNVYEIPERFDIYEESYLKLAEDLYDEIKELRREIILNGDEPWTNLTLSIVKDVLKIEFNYDDLLNSEFSSYERHLIWRYKYLDMPLSSYTRKERKLIQKYVKLNNNKLVTPLGDVYQETLYDREDVSLNENYEKAKELVEKEKLKKLASMKNKKNKKKNGDTKEIIVADKKVKNIVLNDYLTTREKEIAKEKKKKQKEIKKHNVSKERVQQDYISSQGLTIVIPKEDKEVVKDKKRKVKEIKKGNLTKIQEQPKKKANHKIKKEINKVHVILDDDISNIDKTIKIKKVKKIKSEGKTEDKPKVKKIKKKTSSSLNKNKLKQSDNKNQIINFDN